MKVNISGKIKCRLKRGRVCGGIYRHVPVEMSAAEVKILLALGPFHPEIRLMDLLLEHCPKLHRKIIKALKESVKEDVVIDKIDYAVGADVLENPYPEDEILPNLFFKYMRSQVSGGLKSALMAQSPKKRKVENDFFAIMDDHTLNDNQKKIKLLKEKGVEAIELLCRLWEVADEKTRERALKKNVFTPRSLGKEPLYDIRVQSYSKDEEHEKVDGFYKIELYSEELEEAIELKFGRKRAKVLYLWYLSHPDETFKKSALKTHTKEWTDISIACYKEAFDPDKDWPQNRGDANRTVRKALGNSKDFSYWYEISQEGRLDRYFLGRMYSGLNINMDSFWRSMQPNPD